MGDLNALIRKFALQNAVLHDGKAVVKSVMGKVMAEDSTLSSRVKEVQGLVKELVEQVNLMKPEEQKIELEKIAPELLRRESKERTSSRTFDGRTVMKELPPLPNVKDRVVMRLAPYPSGPLHIGNARAVVLNDEYVKKHNGHLVLVFDDTIGSDEKTIDRDAYGQIKEGLDWLGVDIYEVHCKSDRLQLYYDWVEELIRYGFAYVCECSAEILRDCREKEVECAHRDQVVEENMAKWHGMLDGAYGEGQAVLRIRTDMKHPNPAFRDRVLFRISDRVHPRVGRRYRVWPMLEFSWAVDDFAFGITHVLRGKDLVIEDDMERYIWDLLGIEPVEFVHYGMLRLKEMKLSKSRTRVEIEEGTLEGVDDPRTWSLQSLRRRGISPQAIRSFILGFGLSLTDIEVPAENLYAENRKLVDKTANRYFFVPSPVEIKLAHLPKKQLKLSLHPDEKDRGHRTIHLKHKIFVPREDFDNLQGQEIRLKDFCNVILNKDAEFTSEENKEIPRIQWVSEHVPIKVVMPDGSVVEGYGENALKHVHNDDVVQFERFGFVRADSVKDGTFYFAHK